MRPDATSRSAGHHPLPGWSGRNARLIGFEPIKTDAPLLSTALWGRDNPPELLLYVINREAKDSKWVRRKNVEIKLPTAKAPKAVRIVSPDWDSALTQMVDLSDLDRKNDSAAREYAKTFEFAIPPGRHRVTLRNAGGDWAFVAWYAFTGGIQKWSK